MLMRPTGLSRHPHDAGPQSNKRNNSSTTHAATIHYAPDPRMTGA